jgi:ABC-type transport system involved in cytochrome c biogenesis permease subunit
MTTTLRRAARWHRPLMIFTGLMGVTAAVALVGIVVDPRILTGVPIWLKPFKFAISLAIYGITIAWMLSLLPRRSRIAEWAATLIVAMASIEMIAIVGQVIRGQTSHFNDTTPLNSAVWSAMGIAVTVLFVAHLVIAVAAARQRIADRAATYAVRLGLGLSLLGMLAAVPMVLPSRAPAGMAGISGAHTVGLPDGGPGLPLVGWSTVGGDLRIGHFVGLHALQALPLLAIALHLLRHRLDEATRVRLLLVAAAAYAALTVSLTWQAVRGQSLVHPDALTLAAWGTLAVATTAAGALVIRRRTEPVPVLAPEPARVLERQV